MRKILISLLESAIGAAFLWFLALPLLVVFMIAASFFFQAWFALIVFAFPIYCVGVVIYAIWKAIDERRKSRRIFKE